MIWGTMDLGFGSNGVGIHSVAGILIFNPGSGLDCNATDCSYVFALETRAFLLVSICVFCGDIRAFGTRV